MLKCLPPGSLCPQLRLSLNFSPWQEDPCGLINSFLSSFLSPHIPSLSLHHISRCLKHVSSLGSPSLFSLPMVVPFPNCLMHGDVSKEASSRMSSSSNPCPSPKPRSSLLYIAQISCASLRARSLLPPPPLPYSVCLWDSLCHMSLWPLEPK